MPPAAATSAAAAPPLRLHSRACSASRQVPSDRATRDLVAAVCQAIHVMNLSPDGLCKQTGLLLLPPEQRGTPRRPAHLHPHPAQVVEAMREVGIDVSGNVPQKLDAALIEGQGVNVVVTMGW